MNSWGLTGSRPVALAAHEGQTPSRLFKERDTNHLFVFGLGYTGLAAASYFRKLQWKVSGTCRNEEKAKTLRTKYFEAFAFDSDGYQQLPRGGLMALRDATHVLSTIPPDPHGDPIVLAHARDLAEMSKGRLRWVGYVSSTGVYGDHQSDWVDEQSDLLAAHGKGVARVLSEAAWQSLYHEYGVPVHIFRCGGIYGPRRSALEAIKRPIPSSTQQRRQRQKHTARCHVLDVCRTFEASAEKPRPGAVYNVVDDDPAGRYEVEAYAASLLGPCRGVKLDERGRAEHEVEDEREPNEVTGLGERENKPIDTAELGTRGVNHVERGEKRVRNALIKEELGVELVYPTYREGISSLAKGDFRPFD